MNGPSSSSQGTAPPRLWALDAGLVLLLLVVYTASGPRTLPEADAGELAAVAVSGGIPHPPGYPVWTVLLQVAAQLSGVLGLVPALTLVSILASCAAALLLARTLRARGSHPLTAFTATLAVFLGTFLWRDATTFEPFALSNLLACGVLACCQRLARTDVAEGELDARTLLGLGLLFGLGLCHHHPLALLAPLPLSVLAPQLRRAPRVLGLLAAGFLVGTTPLLFFFWLRTQAGWIWGDWDPLLPRLVRHLMRTDYGTLSLAQSGSGSFWYGVRHFLQSLPASLSYVFFYLLVFGLLLAVRQPKALRDRFALGVALSFVTTGIVFPMLFRLHGVGLDALFVDRFFGLAMLLLAFPISAALDAIRPRLHALWLPACAASLLFHATYQWPRAARVGHTFFETHIHNVLAVVPPGAVVLTQGDAGFSIGLYARYVLGRSDISFVFSDLGDDWYDERVGAALASRGARPLFLLGNPVTSMGAEPPSYPLGPLRRVVTPRETMPDASELFARNLALYARFRLPSPAEVASCDAWEASELADYSKAWNAIATRADHEGRPDLAARARIYRDAVLVSR